MTTTIVDDSGARRIACHSFIHAYDAAKATMDQTHQYVECVRFLYPTDEQSAAMKFGILLWFAATSAGVLIGSIFLDDDRAFGAFIGGIIGFVAIPVLALLYWAIT